MGHIHTVTDKDTHFVIDPITRQMTNTSKKLSLTKGDHNSEVFTFEVPLAVEGHDMSKCNRVEVHYINIDSKTRAKSTGVYEVQDFGVDPEDSSKGCGSWLISGNATKYCGSLSFILRFACIPDKDKDGNPLANPVIEYSWSTAIYSGITILDSICNSEEVIEEYTDILQEWYEKLIAITDGAIDLNSKEAVKFWVGTHAEYDALEEIIDDCMYIITDDTTLDTVLLRVKAVEEDMKILKDDHADHVTGTEVDQKIEERCSPIDGSIADLGNRADDITENIESMSNQITELSNKLSTEGIDFSKITADIQALKDNYDYLRESYPVYYQLIGDYRDKITLEDNPPRIIKPGENISFKVKLYSDSYYLYQEYPGNTSHYSNSVQCSAATVINIQQEFEDPDTQENPTGWWYISLGKIKGYTGAINIEIRPLLYT